MERPNRRDDLTLFQEQLNRETQQRVEGWHRTVSAVVHAEQRGYQSSTFFCQKLLKKFLLTIGQRLGKRIHLLQKGGGAVNATLINKHLKEADYNVLTLIALKVSMDILGKNHTPKLCEVTIPIGRAVETELRLSHYLKIDPALYKHVEKGFHRATGTRQKATVFRLRFNKQGHSWESWSNPTAHKIGSWLFDAIAHETSWLSKQTVAVGRKKHTTVVRYSDEFLKLKETLMEKAEALAFLSWPMICKPIPWTNESHGGYLTEEVNQQHPLVRAKGSSLQRVKQGELVLSFLNNVQEVGYVINPHVLTVINWAFENGRTIGKFRRETATTPPNRPIEGATEEQIKAYKRMKREVMDFNAQLEQRNWRATELWYVANKFKDEASLYFPHSFDYRGRIYPLTTGLSPQGTDPEKALLYFAEEGPINEYWLAWHLATAYGLDKKTHDERVKWTRLHRVLIAGVASDPIGHLHGWIEAEEPWTFLAACFEYYHCVIDSTKPTSGLPCGIDATASGIQHLSALTLDREAASKCNVSPSHKPVDGYLAVAIESLKYIKDQTVHPYINRKTTKRTTMTLPYGVTRDSARGYIRQALMEEGKVDLSVKGRLTEITSAIYDKAIPGIFAGPVEVMQWLQSSAKKILEKHETINWRTPSGFIVQQDLRVSKAVRVQTRLLGSVVSCMIGDSWEEPDVKHHVSALAPNLVHSLDASQLALTFAYWDHPFQVIHDCCLARSCDMDQLSQDIRLHFVEMYKAEVLADWAEQVGINIPDGLIKDSLEIEEVLDSKYFFC